MLVHIRSLRQTWGRALLSVIAVCGLANALPAEETDPNLLLTFSTKRFGGWDLVTSDLEGKNVTRLTEVAEGVMEPAWSPDGTQIAYVSYPNAQPHIFVAAADLTNPVDISAVSNSTFDRSPSWSPDGKQLVFNGFRNGYEIMAMNVDGTNVRQLTTDPGFDADPAWSPDGKKIAFTSSRTGFFRLYTMNPDGTEVKDLIGKDLAASVYPAWSPDSRQIVFGGRSANGTVQLFVVNADGTGLQQITPDGPRSCSHSAWSPDGQYIAYVRFDRWPNSIAPTNDTEDSKLGGDLMLYDTINEQHTQITAADGPLWGPRPSWKPTEAK